jgi:hypothetical protein
MPPPPSAPPLPQTQIATQISDWPCGEGHHPSTVTPDAPNTPWMDSRMHACKLVADGMRFTLHR